MNLSVWPSFELREAWMGEVRIAVPGAGVIREYRRMAAPSAAAWGFECYGHLLRPRRALQAPVLAR